MISNLSLSKATGHIDIFLLSPTYNKAVVQELMKKYFWLLFIIHLS